MRPSNKVTLAVVPVLVTLVMSAMVGALQLMGVDVSPMAYFAFMGCVYLQSFFILWLAMRWTKENVQLCRCKNR